MKKTNKTFKRFAAITSASLLAACAMAPVFTSMTSYAAAGEITFKNGEDAETANTYTAYKIFSGTAAASGFDGQAELENIQWANDEAAGLIAKLQTDERFNTTPEPTDEVPEPAAVNDFASCTTAASVADVLKGYQAKSEKAIAFAEVVVDNAEDLELVGTQSEDGVIVLNDTDAADGSTDDGYYVIAQTTHIGVTTAYILGVYDASAGAEVSVKVSQPTFEKKIKDKNDSTGVVSDWQDSADYDIGDHVPYQLKATLPEDYALYNEYMLIFHDTLDSGLTYDANTANIYVNGALWGTPKVTTTNLTDGCNLEFKIDNLKSLTKDDNGTILKIDADDVITVEFTATLNENAKIGSEGNWNKAYLEYSNNPYFTSGTENDEIDNDGDGEVDEKGEETETTDKTKEDKVVAFTYKTVIDKIDEKGNALPGAVFKLEKEIKGEDGTTSWVEIEQVETTPGTTFTFNGLDDGNYRLSETPPTGYNPIEPISFTVSAEHEKESETPALTSLNAGDELKANLVAGTILKKDGTNHNAVSGEIYGEIENKSGATLPGTGGIGTTIFYLGGGAMAAIGGIYLISKRRMRKSEE